MKVKWVPAFRERGLRRKCDAEPQGCERQFKQQERKAGTMKTDLLKTPAPVEPKAATKRRPPPTSLADASSRCSQLSRGDANTENENHFRKAEPLPA
jgi:hypothetical protein